MKNLLQCLPGLERLELVDLQLDGNDGQNHDTRHVAYIIQTRVAGEHVLDEVGDVCSLSLKSLKIVNITREPLSMMWVTLLLST